MEKEETHAHSRVTTRSQLKGTARKQLNQRTKSQLKGTTRSQLKGTTRSQLKGTTRSQLKGTTRSQLKGTTRTCYCITATYNLSSFHSVAITWQPHSQAVCLTASLHNVGLVYKHTTCASVHR